MILRKTGSLQNSDGLWGVYEDGRTDPDGDLLEAYVSPDADGFFEAQDDGDCDDLQFDFTGRDFDARAERIDRDHGCVICPPEPGNPLGRGRGPTQLLYGTQPDNGAVVLAQHRCGLQPIGTGTYTPPQRQPDNPGRGKGPGPYGF